ncbi:MAG: hypothetical protein KJ052_01195 [Candidatus Hydrogenedentes bacterium]|nr:hypothetical protein [Candidatus Hydrogenedentota bacterium]
MKTLTRLIVLLIGTFSSFIFAVCGNAESVTVLETDFSEFDTGVLLGVIGAEAEYHYRPETAPKHGWAVSTFRSEPASQRSWRVLDIEGVRTLVQTYPNKWKHTHPMIAAGDPLWRDYTLEARFANDAPERLCGVVFRVHNDRCYYFFGVQEDTAILKFVNRATAFRKPAETVLATAPFTYEAGEWLTARVKVEDGQIRASLNDAIMIEATDATFTQGGIGLMADGASRFAYVKVEMTEKAEEAFDNAVAVRTAEEKALQAANPQPVLWKKTETYDFGVGRNLRFGDLNGDGQMDFLAGQIRHHGPKDRNSEVSCLTAMTFDGEKLWQIGEPDPWKDHLTNDVAFQIHDLDGDGRNEVIYCMDLQLIVADGATGKTLRSIPTPAMPANTPEPYNKFPRILGDSLFFCDLRGTGRDADLIVKDRYLSFWAYDENLQLLWQAQCNTGHYPYAADIDGDGKDEVAMGYSMFDDDGALLWSLDDTVEDHSDGVAVVDLDLEGEQGMVVFQAASDEGVFLTDIEGNILKHHYLGHVQNPAVANFRPDLPGLETVSVNFWGNQGIIHFFNAQGDIYHDFEPFQHGSMCLPINWSGDGAELVVLSANAIDGVMYDGWGRCAVKLPEDGHPDLCYAVADVTGDCRDELVVWDPYEVWVYTQNDNPRPGRLYNPVRNPLYNYSNYQATVSLPGWSE